MKKLLLVLVMLFSCLLLVSCAPNADYEKAQSSLKDAGYTVVVVEDDTPIVGALLPDGCVASLTASNKDGELVLAYYFSSSNEAKDYFENGFNDRAEQYLEDCEKKTEVGWQGKIVYCGSVQGLKDAK